MHATRLDLSPHVAYTLYKGWEESEPKKDCTLLSKSKHNYCHVHHRNWSFVSFYDQAVLRAADDTHEKGLFTLSD